MDNNFVRIAKIRLVDVDNKRDELDPTLRDYAGYENGHEVMAEIYSDGSAWFHAGVNHGADSEYGLVRENDWISADNNEYEVIE